MSFSAAATMSDKVPEWLEALIEKQTASITGAITQQLSSFMSDQASGSGDDNSVLKRSKCSNLDNVVPEKKARTVVEDECDDFDRRFGHLFNLDVNNNTNDSEGDGLDLVSDNLEEVVDDAGTGATGTLDDEDNVSVDEDLVDGSEAENWDLSSSIKQFLLSNVDKSLTDEFLQQISHSFIPKEKFIALFTAPKMPKRLFTVLHRMKS